MSPSPLRDALSTRDNALNFVRLGLAVVVIFDHAWAVGGFAPEPTFEPAIWAVNGFFAISGYLIAGSRMRLSIGRYLTSRFLRIYPAYAVVLIATAFLIAPLSTLLTGEIWSAPSAGGYVLQNAGLYIFQLGIDDTLTEVPFPRAWNGSLWTLFYEFACYVAAGLMLSIALVRRKPLASSAVLLAALIVTQFLISPVDDVIHPVIVNTVRLFGFFAAGMVLYFLSSRISSRPRNVLISIGLVAILGALGLAEQLAQLPFAYLLLVLGAKLPIRLGSRTDLSYGLYIWSFPIQQLMAIVGVTWLGPLGAAALAVALTLPIAWLSWTYVEQPAMQLRKRLQTTEPPRR